MAHSNKCAKCREALPPGGERIVQCPSTGPEAGTPCCSTFSALWASVWLRVRPRCLHIFLDPASTCQGPVKPLSLEPCASCLPLMPCRALPGFQPKINTALWNTIQLLFPLEAAAAQPATPPEPALQPSSNRLNMGGFRLNSGLRQGGRAGSAAGSERPPVLTNPFRPAWQQRQEIQVGGGLV